MNLTNEIFKRSKILIGEENLNKLKNSHVAVFGLGGVGSAAVEALARAGIGKLSIFDSDKINLSNINRQIIATNSTVGVYKTDVEKSRILDINPKAEVIANKVFYCKENADDFSFASYDYIIDAIDTISSKLLIIKNARESKTPIISCMGTGKKLDPTKFEVIDIYKTSVCPLARAMRRELKKLNIKKLKVVYSKEQPINTNEEEIGSISFVPPVAGFILASEVVKDLIKLKGKITC